MERTLLGLKCKNCGSATLSWLGLTQNQTNNAGCIFCGRLCTAARLAIPDDVVAKINGFFKETQTTTPLQSTLAAFFSDNPGKQDLRHGKHEAMGAGNQPAKKILNANCPFCKGTILTRPGENGKVTKERCLLCGKQINYETYWMAEDTLPAIHEFFRKLKLPMRNSELRNAFRRFFWDDPEKPKTKGWF